MDPTEQQNQNPPQDVEMAEEEQQPSQSDLNQILTQKLFDTEQVLATERQSVAELKNQIEVQNVQLQANGSTLKTWQDKYQEVCDQMSQLKDQQSRENIERDLLEDKLKQRDTQLSQLQEVLNAKDTQFLEIQNKMHEYVKTNQEQQQSGPNAMDQDAEQEKDQDYKMTYKSLKLQFQSEKQLSLLASKTNENQKMSIQTLSEQLESQKAQVQQKESVVEEQEQELKKLQENIKQFRSKVHDLQMQYQQLVNDTKKEHEQVELSEAQLVKTRQAQADQIQHLSNRNTKLESQNQALMMQIREQAKKLQFSFLHEFQDQIKSINEETSLLRESHEREQNLSQELEKAKKQLQSYPNVQALQNQITQMQKQVGDYYNLANDMRSQLESKSTYVTSLKQQASEQMMFKDIMQLLVDKHSSAQKSGLDGLVSAEKGFTNEEDVVGVLKDCYKNMRMAVAQHKGGLAIKEYRNARDLKEVTNLSKMSIRSERQNFLKLLRHVQKAICGKETKEKQLASLLEHLTEKLTEIKEVVFDGKKEGTSDERVSQIEARFQKSSDNFKSQVQMLENQYKNCKEQNSKYLKQIEDYQRESQNLIKELHELRSNGYLQNQKVAELNDKLFRDAAIKEIMNIRLKNKIEEVEVYKQQASQLQEYVQNVSLIKEQFNSSRVAENQVQIMQDLQKTNIDLSIENQKNLEKITQLQNDLLSLKDLGQTQSQKLNQNIKMITEQSSEKSKRIVELEVNIQNMENSQKNNPAEVIQNENMIVEPENAQKTEDFTMIQKAHNNSVSQLYEQIDGLQKLNDELLGTFNIYSKIDKKNLEVEALTPLLEKIQKHADSLKEPQVDLKKQNEQLLLVCQKLKDQITKDRLMFKEKIAQVQQSKK